MAPTPTPTPAPVPTPTTNTNTITTSPSSPTNIPNTRIGKVVFYESRIDPWTEHADTIGLNDNRVAALAADTAAARAEYQAMLAARQAAVAATQRFHTAVAAMHRGPGRGSDMLAEIRTFAQTTNDAGVYTRARLSPPAGRNALPPPGTPTGFHVNLLQNGAIELTWTCKNPPRIGGTMYEVWRGGGGSRQASGPMKLLGTVGHRRFVDNALTFNDLPGTNAPGTNASGTDAEVVYQVVAIRSTTRGNPARFLVRFGARPKTNNSGISLAA